MRSKARIGLAMVLAMAIAGAASAATSIKDSKHDLSSGSAATVKGNTDQICVYCHTPHNATQNIPLWNRNNPVATGFTLYSSVSMQNTPVKNGFTTDSISLFCMSCHDGSTALGAAAVHNNPVDQPTGITVADVAGRTSAGHLDGASKYNLTTNLADDHPVNFLVTSGADPNIGTVTGATMKTGSVTNGFPLFKSGRGATTLECGSCHAVHDNTDPPFLRTTMAGSKLCLGCHIK
ncbi:cytochrome C [Geobacter hydrogenophilus]|uniref:Cytochrome c n=1 Tax=Geobacter hydrogenophilus TaxID=40983 RepID=A0A9W6FYT2_9BACT|nr:cytochrome c3 family protein [Geobacter hydrogenophilus]MBT0894776.1 cytochrome C [Geobacter hydrogenophilus]GLI37386.1 cytochrome c [Geobacter hydrogenophilus]